MSHLDPDRLSLIALGEPATADEREHLEVCDQCALDLAELEYTVVVGRSTVALGDLEAPPDRVWVRIADELHLGGSAEASAARAPGATPAPLDADAPPEAAAASVPSDRKDDAPALRRRRMRMLFALAASVALVVGAITTWSLVRQAQPVEIAAATLDAFPDHPDASGSAVVIEKADGERRIEVDLDDRERDDGYREVWLIKADASDLVSLGVLEGSSGTFAVPDGVDLRDYVLVDVSQEPADGNPTHSGDSIVRGELGFA